MRRIFVVLLSIMMTFGLVANGKSDQKSSGGEKMYNGIDVSDHVVITYMTTGEDPGNGATEELIAKLNTILTDKINAEIEIYYINWTNYLSNYNLTLAQMDGAVDLVGTASDWLDSWPNAKNGAFLELSEDMLKTYAPRTWASVPADHWDVCRYGGDIYFMPEDNFTQWVNHGFTYRIDWANEAGLTSGINSWEDMTTYFKSIRANHPDITPWDSDGTHNIALASGWVQSHTNFVSIDGICSGGLYGGTRDDLFHVTSPFYETDVLVEFAELMREWDEMGVWKTDVLNNTGVDDKAEFKLGQVAAQQHHTETWFGTNEPDLREQNPDAGAGFFWFGKESGNLVSLNIIHGSMAVSAASKNPERALMVYDFLRNDPECYKLINYGVEGRQYELDANGRRVQPADYVFDDDRIQTNFWWGRNDDLEIRDARRDWDAYEKLCADYDKVAIIYPYGQFIPEVDSIQAQINNINEIHGNYMKQIAYGKFKGSARDIVAEYQDALKKAGIEDVIAEIQKQIDALYK